MLYRYKVEKEMGWGQREVTIQKYCPNTPIIKWHRVEKVPLRLMIKRLHTEEFQLYNWYEINDKMLCETLQEYKTMEELVMKYIMKIRKQQIRQDDEMNFIDAFVLTNGWNTIEVKENEE